MLGAVGVGSCGFIGAGFCFFHASQVYNIGHSVVLI
jgi:hypothetical protein